ncbi:putative transmembrane protein [Toxoplasma gondii MAS]|uniref:Putative transmembrane protein n=2 Tax=Toxoplasma gondii TaxID=5811 RepID=A0A086PPP1_TOXGO|nr:putative transmembrane protein [Toxoplasma gondii MAS]PUA83596.1 putative transmembrane protein [Toxoplasma gondii TgCATBr9]
MSFQPQKELFVGMDDFDQQQADDMPDTVKKATHVLEYPEFAFGDVSQENIFSGVAWTREDLPLVGLTWTEPAERAYAEIFKVPSTRESPSEPSEPRRMLVQEREEIQHVKMLNAGDGAAPVRAHIERSGDFSDRCFWLRQPSRLKRSLSRNNPSVNYEPSCSRKWLQRHEQTLSCCHSETDGGALDFTSGNGSHCHRSSFQSLPGWRLTKNFSRVSHVSDQRLEDSAINVNVSGKLVSKPESMCWAQMTGGTLDCLEGLHIINQIGDGSDEEEGDSVHSQNSMEEDCVCLLPVVPLEFADAGQHSSTPARPSVDYRAPRRYSLPASSQYGRLKSLVHPRSAVPSSETACSSLRRAPDEPQTITGCSDGRCHVDEMLAANEPSNEVLRLEHFFYFMSYEDARLLFATIDYDGQGFVTREQFTRSLQDLHRDVWRYRAADEVNSQILHRIHLLLALITAPAACLLALFLFQTFLTFCVAAAVAIIYLATIAFAAPRVYRFTAVWHFLGLQHPIDLGDFVELLLPAGNEASSSASRTAAAAAEVAAAAAAAATASVAVSREGKKCPDDLETGAGGHERAMYVDGENGDEQPGMACIAAAPTAVFRGRCVKIGLREVVLRTLEENREVLRLPTVDVARCRVRNFSRSASPAHVSLQLHVFGRPGHPANVSLLAQLQRALVAFCELHPEDWRLPLPLAAVRAKRSVPGGGFLVEVNLSHRLSWDHVTRIRRARQIVCWTLSQLFGTSVELLPNTAPQMQAMMMAANDCPVSSITSSTSRGGR